MKVFLINFVCYQKCHNKLYLKNAGSQALSFILKKVFKLSSQLTYESFRNEKIFKRKSATYGSIFDLLDSLNSECNNLLTKAYFLFSISKVFLRSYRVLETEKKRVINQANGNVLREKSNQGNQKKRIKREEPEHLVDIGEMECSDFRPDTIEFDCELSSGNRNLESLNIEEMKDSEIIIKKTGTKTFSALKKRMEKPKRVFILELISRKVQELKGETEMERIEDVRDYDIGELMINSDIYENTNLFSSSHLSSNIVNEMETSNIYCFNEKLKEKNRGTQVAAFAKLLEMLNQEKITVEQSVCYGDIYVFVQ